MPLDAVASAWCRQPVSHCWPHCWLQPPCSSWQCPVLHCWAWRSGKYAALSPPQAGLLSHCFHGQNQQLNTQIPLEENTDAVLRLVAAACSDHGHW